MENVVKPVKVKVGFQPTPAKWGNKPLKTYEIDNGVTVKAFLADNQIPYSGYPSCLLDGQPLDEKNFGEVILQKDQILMFSKPITGNE